MFCWNLGAIGLSDIRVTETRLKRKQPRHHGLWQSNMAATRTAAPCWIGKEHGNEVGKSPLFSWALKDVWNFRAPGLQNRKEKALRLHRLTSGVRFSKALKLFGSIIIIFFASLFHSSVLDQEPCHLFWHFCKIHGLLHKTHHRT